MHCSSIWSDALVVPSAVCALSGEAGGKAEASAATKQHVQNTLYIESNALSFAAFAAEEPDRARGN